MVSKTQHQLSWGLISLSIFLLSTSPFNKFTQPLKCNRISDDIEIRFVQNEGYSL